MQGGDSLVIPGTSPEDITARTSAALFQASPTAVLADSSADLGAIGNTGVPVLVVSGAAGAEAAAVVTAELGRLGADTILALGPEATTLAQTMPVEVVADITGLPDIAHADGQPDTAVITADPEVSGLDSTTAAAVAATATAAGATQIRTHSGDPRESQESVDAVAGIKSTRVIGIGDALGDHQQLATRVAAATTGVHLPGGGQLPASGKQYIALYGHPGVPSLGVLGEQDLDATVRRAKEQASAYENLTDETVVPMFEIITTVALGQPSPNGNYTNEVDPEVLRPWVERAAQEGIYVVLDLQPGRADLLDQAKKYESLLRHPHVGLAIDPEWKLRPEQRPLQQIGQVQADEVNRVSEWLCQVTEANQLPQKLFVLHQFQLRMLPDRDRIITDRDALQTLIHIDGQGGQSAKQDTWRVMQQNPPPNVVWGWKNFHDEDQPMLTPQQTADQVDPRPVMISYQ